MPKRAKQQDEPVMASPSATMWCLASEKKAMLPQATKAANTTKTNLSRCEPIPWEGDENMP